VSQVTIFGTRDYEVGIEVSEERLREYGLTFGQVAAAVRQGSLNMSAGVLRTKGQEIRLRTVGRKYTAEDFSKIVLLARPNGEIITLDRIADIRDEFVEDPVLAAFNGEPCVLVACFKTREEDAIGIAEEVHKYVSAKQSALPPGVTLSVWSDRAEMIQARLNMMRYNGIQGLIIVVVLLWLLMDARLSFFVALGIPISFGGALAIMYMRGDTLNMLSLFGLIMVLGMLVDDAIVVGEAIHFHRQQGEPPLEAAMKGVEEVGLPVTGAVITTIVAFIPLMFVGGGHGQVHRDYPDCGDSVPGRVPFRIAIPPAGASEQPSGLEREYRQWRHPASSVETLALGLQRRHELVHRACLLTVCGLGASPPVRLAVRGPERGAVDHGSGAGRHHQVRGLFEGGRKRPGGVRRVSPRYAHRRHGRSRTAHRRGVPPYGARCQDFQRSTPYQEHL